MLQSNNFIVAVAYDYIFCFCVVSHSDILVNSQKKGKWTHIDWLCHVEKVILSSHFLLQNNCNSADIMLQDQRHKAQSRFRLVEASHVQWWTGGGRWLSASQSPHWVVFTINQSNLSLHIAHFALPLLFNLFHWTPTFAFGSFHPSTTSHSNTDNGREECPWEKNREPLAFLLVYKFLPSMA